MKKMVLLGFGCFSLILFVAFKAPDKGFQDMLTVLNSDTVITADESVAATSPIGAPLQREAVFSSLEPTEGYATIVANTSGNNNISFSRIGSFKLHPMAVSYVKDYQEDNEERLQKMKASAMAQFSLIDNVLSKYNLPKELKYLAVIESDLSTNAVSWKGAVGPWQLMAPTGRLLGLKITRYHDERKNLYKSTNAAALYLRDLYSEFNDWLLVIAAYNGGSAKVESAIRKSRSRNFWKLQYYLPTESRNHVKKFIATHYIMEGQGGVTTTVTADINSALKANKLTAEELANTKVLSVSGKFNSGVIARTLGMELAQFNHLNPDFDKLVDVSVYDMRLPIDKTDLFDSKKYEILNESVQLLLTTSVEDVRAKYPEEIKLPVNTEKKTVAKTTKKSIKKK